MVDAQRIVALQASHEELVKAVQTYKRRHEGDTPLFGAAIVSCRCSACDIACTALANAAKLAPSRTGGSGCANCQAKEVVRQIEATR